MEYYTYNFSEEQTELINDQNCLGVLSKYGIIMFTYRFQINQEILNIDYAMKHYDPNNITCITAIVSSLTVFNTMISILLNSMKCILLLLQKDNNEPIIYENLYYFWSIYIIFIRPTYDMYDDIDKKLLEINNKIYKTPYVMYLEKIKRIYNIDILLSTLIIHKINKILNASQN